MWWKRRREKRKRRGREIRSETNAL